MTVLRCSVCGWDAHEDEGEVCGCGGRRYPAAYREAV